VTFRFVKYQVHEYSEEDKEYDLNVIPGIEVTVKPKLTILAVKKRIIEEMELTDVKFSELVVCNMK